MGHTSKKDKRTKGWIKQRERTDAKVLAFIIAYKIEHGGVAPSLRGIMAGTNIKAAVTIQQSLDRLRIAGKIEFESKKARTIQVVGLVMVSDRIKSKQR